MNLMDTALIVGGVGVGLAALGFWVWMLVDCVTRETTEGLNKVVWVIVLVTTKVVGATIYYFVGRAPRIRPAG